MYQGMLGCNWEYIRNNNSNNKNENDRNRLINIHWNGKSLDMIYYNYTRFEDKMKFFLWFLFSPPQRPLTSNHKIFIPKYLDNAVTDFA